MSEIPGFKYEWMPNSGIVMLQRDCEARALDRDVALLEQAWVAGCPKCCNPLARAINLRIDLARQLRDHRRHRVPIIKGNPLLKRINTEAS